MNESFKRKLQAYHEGTLSEAEREEIEAELEKLEAYQVYLDEAMNEEEESRERSEDQRRQREEGKVQRLKERKIIRRAKWKSRGITVLIVLIVMGAVWGGSKLATKYYYTQREVGSTGQAMREVNQQALSSIVEMTMPNRYLAINLQDPGVFFDMNIEGSVQHKVGSHLRSEKELRQRYLWGRIRDTRVQSRDSAPYMNDLTRIEEGSFWLPGGSERATEQAGNAKVWQALSELPKMTVSELYISLDKEYEQPELDDAFAGLRVTPDWFAVRSGQEWAGVGYTIGDEKGNSRKAQPAEYLNLSVQYPIGLSWAGDVFLSPGEKPDETRSWADGMVRALKRIAQSPEVAKSVSSIDFGAAAAEVQKNGGKVYGVVVTGRSEELAKLQGKAWMKGAIVRMGESMLDTEQDDPYVPQSQRHEVSLP
ncbi:hypothetical protein B9G55_09460 [Saccharibacillus sp. O16]|nr:hypothetical protein B9G55_09460 [Saccharibacillus sp. O16]